MQRREFSNEFSMKFPLCFGKGHPETHSLCFHLSLADLVNELLQNAAKLLISIEIVKMKFHPFFQDLNHSVVIKIDAVCKKGILYYRCCQ